MVSGLCCSDEGILRPKPWRSPRPSGILAWARCGPWSAGSMPLLSPTTPSSGGYGCRKRACRASPWWAAPPLPGVVLEPISTQAIATRSRRLLLPAVLIRGAWRRQSQARRDHHGQGEPCPPATSSAWAAIRASTSLASMWSSVTFGLPPADQCPVGPFDLCLVATSLAGFRSILA